jgi:taurine dioxygenase
MDPLSGPAFLDEIYEAATRDDFVYAHQWRVGDLVLWDNGFTMHRRTPFDPGARRLMKRMTLHLDPKRHVMPDGALAESGIGMPV